MFMFECKLPQKQEERIRSLLNSGGQEEGPHYQACDCVVRRNLCILLHHRGRPSRLTSTHTPTSPKREQERVPGNAPMIVIKKILKFAHLPKQITTRFSTGVIWNQVQFGHAGAQAGRADGSSMFFYVVDRKEQGSGQSDVEAFMLLHCRTAQFSTLFSLA